MDSIKKRLLRYFHDHVGERVNKGVLSAVGLKGYSVMSGVAEISRTMPKIIKRIGFGEYLIIADPSIPGDLQAAKTTLGTFGRGRPPTDQRNGLSGRMWEYLTSHAGEIISHKTLASAGIDGKGTAVTSQLSKWKRMEKIRRVGVGRYVYDGPKSELKAHVPAVSEPLIARYRPRRRERDVNSITYKTAVAIDASNDTFSAASLGLENTAAVRQALRRFSAEKLVEKLGFGTFRRTVASIAEVYFEQNGIGRAASSSNTDVTVVDEIKNVNHVQKTALSESLASQMTLPGGRGRLVCIVTGKKMEFVFGHAVDIVPRNE